MLSVRQQQIINAVSKVSVLADVGCDHGYIGVGVLQGNLADKVYFIDISKPSLNKAKRLCSQEGLNERAEFLHQDGLGCVKCDCAVIAGIGGLEIISILSCPTCHLPDKLVLQPMRNVPQLRQYLQQYYRFQTDYTFFDKKYYSLMRLNRGSDCLSQDEILFGRTNLEQMPNDFTEWATTQRDKYDKLSRKVADHEIQQQLDAFNRILEKRR